ncbi:MULTISPECIES: hypothetical protein [unclassified Bradyrhizobium]|uniref:hypothetical protein n=1 Tax=unclassified Bradyrhizobium TaxID=2631580 RepID=UPI0028E42F39|nr:MULTISPECIES: hypothetical protein [unclassified Bradyrhizobium]
MDADIPRNETFEQRELLPRMPELQHAFVTSLSLYSARYSAQCLFNCAIMRIDRSTEVDSQ